MGEELSITVRNERGVVVAEVTGDIDMSTVAGLRNRLPARYRSLHRAILPGTPDPGYSLWVNSSAMCAAGASGASCWMTEAMLIECSASTRHTSANTPGRSSTSSRR